MKQAVAGLALLMVLASPATSSAATTTTNYTYSPATIANPERGFFIQHSRCEKQPFDPVRLARYRAEEAISLMRCVFYLPKTSDISAQITEFEAQAARLRTAGLKMVLRFAYTESTVGDDATPTRVQEHLGLLTDTLRRNSDVIAVMESGFVGAWGEGYYTQNFGNQGVVNSNQWAARNAVVDRLLRILPLGRKVLVRTPKMKWQMFGETSATPADVNSGGDVARVGHVNDCFLSNEFDSGTYTRERKSDEYEYLARDTRYVPMGGETCGKEAGSSRSECPTARQELGLFHFSYLNARYHGGVLDGWTSGGCMEEVRQRLGYRLALVSATAPTAVTRGTTMAFAMTIHNHGWSGAINNRPVKLVLRNTTTDALHRFSLGTAKDWYAGNDRSINKSIPIPSTVPVGTYALLLSLPDPDPSLANHPTIAIRAKYAIQLANTGGLWDPGTGFNHLLRTVKVQ